MLLSSFFGVKDVKDGSTYYKMWLKTELGHFTQGFFATLALHLCGVDIYTAVVIPFVAYAVKEILDVVITGYDKWVALDALTAVVFIELGSVVYQVIYEPTGASYAVLVVLLALAGWLAYTWKNFYRAENILPSKAYLSRN